HVRPDAPRDDVLRPRGRVLRLEVEPGAGAVERVGVHEAVRGRGDHEAALPGGVVGFSGFQRAAARYLRVEHVHGDLVARVHQQRAGIGREGGQVAALRARRPGGHAVGLDEAEVDWLDALRITGPGSVAAAFQAVDVERRAPVRV